MYIVIVQLLQYIGVHKKKVHIFITKRCVYNINTEQFCIQFSPQSSKVKQLKRNSRITQNSMYDITRFIAKVKFEIFASISKRISEREWNTKTE
jgi:hypothetical protein